MLRKATARLACGLAAVAYILYCAARSEASSSCSLETLLNTSFSFAGGRYSSIPSGCSLLGSSGKPLSVSTSLTLKGDSSPVGSLDTAFLTDAVVFAPGAALTLESLRLYNVRFGQDSLFSLSAFDVSQLTLLHVTLETDCGTLRALTASNPANSVRDSAYLYVANYTSANVRAIAVNITCDLPTSGDGSSVSVADSLQLFNVLAANATDPAPTGSLGSLTILATQNITISAAVWKRPSPLVVTRNVTLLGPLGTFNVLDFNVVIGAVSLSRDVMFTLQNFNIVNAGALRGVLQQTNILPSLSIPIWFFQFARIPAAPQLTLTGCTLLLPTSEYQYFYAWTLVTTSVIVNDVAAQLRSSTVAINFTSSTNETLHFSRLTSTGLDYVNITLTFIVRGAQYTPGLVLDNPLLVQSFGAVNNLTLIPVYDIYDLMSVLAAAQASPVRTGLVFCMLQNITIDPEIWPAGGYTVPMPVLMAGQSNAGRITWLNFRRVQNFVRAVGCTPDSYMYVQGMHLVNMPNGMLQSAGSALAGGPAAAATAAGLSDVTIYMTNFQGVPTNCDAGWGPSLFLNQTTVVVTYTEFRLVHVLIMRSVGTSTNGSGTAVGWPFAYVLSNVVLDNIFFLSVSGWGWNGFKVNLTYASPAGVPMLYNNLYEPLGEAQPPPSNDGSLKAWQIALIVIGGVLLLALVASLIAWRTSVRRLRHEVDAVKSGNTDKKSSDASADQDTASAGGHLGSSAGIGGGAGGGANQLDNGGGNDTPGLSAAAKGSLNGGGRGTGGGGGGGGNSEDSAAAAPQYDKPPLEVLNNMMASLTHELDDQHLAILEVIGQGGFGVVYRGLWKGLNVAVKTITFQDRVAGGEKAQHRAILEAAISSSLAHPNVVTTYSYDIKPMTVQGASVSDSPDSGPGAAGQSGGGGGIRMMDRRTVLDWKLYLIQEFCDGGSLRTAILKRKFFDAKKGEPRMEMILDTCLELAGGLVHLHERNIIHGDLNPNNVLLKRDATKKYGAVCKIADFGLSIKMNADQSHISNMRRGTPFYTCPQILARGNMTKAADVYSIGVMMWEMYHCCMSYRSLPSGFAARENFPNFPRKASHEFAGLVYSCLDTEPSRRPPFTALRSALEAQLMALKRGEMRTGEEVLGPDHSGDAAHFAACQD